MKVIKFLLLVFLVVFEHKLEAQAQDQSGFYSLLCGSPPNTIYDDSSTRLRYISDSKFIDTGVGKPIQPEYSNSNFLIPSTGYTRSFPIGNRNCYRFNLTKGDQYLIRAVFQYGNYDGLEKDSHFELHLGPNLWATLHIDRKYMQNILMKEIIHVLTSDVLQICLVKLDDTVPFISVLELRRLRNSPYDTKYGSLEYYSRVNCGADFEVGYNGDYYDRLWVSDWNTGDSKNLSGYWSPDEDNDYKPPQLAMDTAIIPADATEPLNVTDSLLYWKVDSDAFTVRKGTGPREIHTISTLYYVMYFAEIQNIGMNVFREFNIFYNGSYSEPINPSSSPSIYTITTANGNSDVSLIRTAKSTLPPLLNAVEVYTLLTLPQSDTIAKEVEAMVDIKRKYRLSKISWQGDPCVPRNYSWEDISCTYNNYDPPTINYLNLSSNGLRGEVPPYISNLTNLSILDLSNNKLTGSIPDFLSGMKSLTFLNLSNNKLSGQVPDDLIVRKEKGSLTLSLEGNHYLCDSCKKKNIIIIYVVASVASLLFLVAAFATILWFKNKKPKNIEAAGFGIGRPRRLDGPALATNNRSFAYSDVEKMTNNFNRVLGKGGFGIVYHGNLDNTQVAVKILSQTSIQGYKEFQTEVELLLRVHHRNLTSLVGYCDEGDKLVLIYEFMANGDLRENLSGKRGTHVLSWEDRLRIALESAQGLEYLHHGCTPPIVHRDVKSTNILLNEQFKAKLADFGLSRLFPLGSQTYVSTVVAGTPGYLDPDYYRTNWLTEKSDVYSFGIVILELITNQPAIDQKRVEPHIGEWVALVLGQGDIRKIVDPSLKQDIDANSVLKVAELAMSCIRQSSRERPSMADVVIELKECLSTEIARMQGSGEIH